MADLEWRDIIWRPWTVDWKELWAGATNWLPSKSQDNDENEDDQDIPKEPNEHDTDDTNTKSENNEDDDLIMAEIRESKPSPSKTTDSGMTGGEFSFGSGDISDTESSEDWIMHPVKSRTRVAAF